MPMCWRCNEHTYKSSEECPTCTLELDEWSALGITLLEALLLAHARFDAWDRIQLALGKAGLV